MNRISFILLLVFSVLFSSCEVNNTVYIKPVMKTYEPENILSNSVKLSGNTIGEGGTQIHEYGFVYGTNFPPTINDIKHIEGSGLGSFSKTYLDLNANTTYYCAAYGINDQGVGYGDIWEFTTNLEPTCQPVNNYFQTTSGLTIPNGNISYTTLDDDSNLGGDYHMKGKKGSFSSSVEIEVHLDGSFEELLTGAYPIISDLDFAFQTPNKAAVLLRYYGSYFRPINYENSYVFIHKEGNTATITLCDVEFSGSINNNNYDTLVTANYSVTE